MERRLGLVLAVAALTAACSELMHKDRPPVIAVSPPLSAVFEGQGGTQQLSAFVDGATTPAHAAWSTSAAATQITVDSLGVATVSSTTPAGDYEVFADAEGVTGVARIRVLPRLTGWFAFAATVNGNGQIFLKDFSANADPVQLTSGVGSIGGLAVDGSTQTIYFARISGGTDVYSIKFDGTGLTNLTNDPVNANQTPAVNPVTHDVFLSRRFGTTGQIFRMRPDGTQLTQITTGAQSKVTPAVSPDGTQLAWTELFQPGSNQEVVASAIDGSNPLQVTNRPGTDASPFWLTNQRLLFGVTLTGPANFEIFLADAPVGENLLNLTNAPTAESMPSTGCATNAFTFLSSRAGGVNDAYYWNFGTALIVRYSLGSVRYSMSWAQRVC